MLENLNEQVCVSRHTNKDQNLWACYEPIERHPNSNNPYGKRQMWKRLTGLLTTSEMYCYLEKNYCSIEISDKFISISA
jgi:hypothetical protein